MSSEFPKKAKVHLKVIEETMKVQGIAEQEIDGLIGIAWADGKDGEEGSLVMFNTRPDMLDSAPEVLEKVTGIAIEMSHLHHGVPKEALN